MSQQKLEDAIREARKFYRKMFDKYGGETTLRSICGTIGAACHNSHDPDKVFIFSIDCISASIAAEKFVEGGGE